MPEKHHPTPAERDERVSVPLTPDEFVRAVLEVDPDEPEDEDDKT